MKREDKERLGHMLDAIAEIREFDGVRDAKTCSAIERKVTIIGEAANHVSDEIVKLYTDIPWADIVGYRNILVHAYFGADESALWDVVDNHLDELESQIVIIFENEKNKGGQ